MALFNYTGTNPSQPSSYTLHSGPNPPVCLAPTQRMCTLEAANDGLNKPIITPALKDEIINSLENEVNGPNVSLKKR
ncbi:hypothetical protein ACFX5U_07755 [Sphingobacterium sp. SG20118]|uniref:hypothetical protein n=1 Tax=Sphingobacterium sp. SG20118 TaxID=3367156 RepID=UPI0037DFC169